VMWRLAHLKLRYEEQSHRQNALTHRADPWHAPMQMAVVSDH
jgi:hypothetical protein